MAFNRRGQPIDSRHRPDDVHALAFRVRMLRIGLWPSVFTAGYCIVYAGLTWNRPHREVLLVLAVLAAMASMGMARLPIERVVSGRSCELFFLGWSASAIAAIGWTLVLDGGVSSPLAPLLFLPLVYAALSYPLKSMLAVGAMTLSAYASVGLVVGGVSTVAAGLFGCMLITATWVCAWQALSHAEQHKALTEVSRSDPLTGCLNRRGFQERFAAELDDCGRHGGQLGLVLIDLDNFKVINDTHGHAVGDELLCWVATTLHETVRPRDAIGRLGGDEFGVLLPEREAEPSLIRERLLTALAERTGASIGIATFPGQGTEESILHQVADADLYANKRGERRGPREGGDALGWAAPVARRPAQGLAAQTLPTRS